MALIFNSSSSSKREVLYSNKLSASNLDSAELKQTNDDFYFGKSRMSFLNWCFDGYRIANSILQQERPEPYEIRNNIDTVKFYFNVKGTTEMQYKQLGKGYTLKPGQFNILYASQLDTKVLHTDNCSEIFSLQMTKHNFLSLIDGTEPGIQKFADSVDKNKAVLYSERWLYMNNAVNHCIKDILSCNYINGLRKLYLVSKSNELFVLLSSIFPDANENKSPIKSSDIVKLYAVKDFVIANFNEQISFPGITKEFGINGFKLKKGFKELFNTSVIDFLINCRLEYSRELLMDRKKTVSEIAYETGYSCPNYFSRSFKKKYGISPTKFT